MTKISIKIHESWREIMHEEFESQYFRDLKKFLEEERSKHNIFPPGPQIFAAFNHTPFDKVKAVILGQDPYHRRGQANGLSFSVSPGVSRPASLGNIFKELHSDLGVPIPSGGNLEPWADQGVLLLNSVLTVREGSPGSHQGKGWEHFTDAVIKKLSSEKKGIVFMLWGRFAHSKESLIDAERHYILKAAHPSPLARGAFFGCRHFSAANKILEHQGKMPIDWKLD
jgi:uracil-DNA glycosylase